MAAEKGAQKEICQWFIKGNCKFGHKCALAHLLPGQPIAMDRKNKKAAQLSNAANNSNQPNGESSREKQTKRARANQPTQNINGGHSALKERDRNADQGAEQQLRVSFKSPGMLSATAPSESADPNFTFPQRSEQENVPIANTGTSNTISSPVPADTTSQSSARPTVPKRFSSGRNGSSDLGYGPIGSPPGLSSLRPNFQASSNHFSPSTSPPAGQMQPSTSPFAQNDQQFFGAYVRERDAQRIQAAPNPIAIQKGSWQQPMTFAPEKNENAVASDEDDFEEFLPSSLTDLLTPEERQRRLSRSGGTRAGESNHRYSRSVPAARLLEAANAWKDVPADRDPSNLSVASLSLRSGFTGEGFSPSHLTTSNASGAFLHQYNRNNVHLARPVASQSFEETDVLGTGLAASTIRQPGSRYESPYSIQGANRVTQLNSDTLSPSSRALQSHAPGQSLPQGLAAGLSRLHLIPAGGQPNGMKLPNGLIDRADGKSTVRSPLRSHFGVGTPPESRANPLTSLMNQPHLHLQPTHLSSSPSTSIIRPSWTANVSTTNRAPLVPTQETEDPMFDLDT